MGQINKPVGYKELARTIKEALYAKGGDFANVAYHPAIQTIMDECLLRRVPNLNVGEDLRANPGGMTAAEIAIAEKFEPRDDLGAASRAANARAYEVRRAVEDVLTEKLGPVVQR